MILTELLDRIGDHADLLTYGDAWLEHERVTISSELQRKISYLDKVIAAQQIKRMLQDKNLVAVQHIERSANNEITDVIIKLMKLPDAIKSIEKTTDTLDEINAAGQIFTWATDGYDIVSSRSLRE